MKIILLCFILFVDLIDEYACVIYSEGHPVGSHNGVDKCLFESKLLRALNNGGGRALGRNSHVKLFCTEISPREVLCSRKDVLYKIKLQNDISSDRTAAESTIRSVFENVEMRMRGEPSPRLAQHEALANDKSNPGGCIESEEDSRKVPENELAKGIPSTGCAGFVTVVPFASSPIVIVLPPETKGTTRCGVFQTSTTAFPYVPCKLCDLNVRQWKPVDPDRYLVIECDPNEFGSVVPCGFENQTLSQKREFSNPFETPKPQVYSCRWQGKRDARPRTVFFLVAPIKLRSRHERAATSTLLDIQYYTPRTVSSTLPQLNSNQIQRESIPAN